MINESGLSLPFKSVVACRPPEISRSLYLEACALNGAKAPEPLGPWLPWNFIGPEAAGVEDAPPRPPLRPSRARAP